MKRSDRPPRQLPLMAAADIDPPDDPVGVALGVAVGDPDGEWRLVMDLYSRMAARAYHTARAESAVSP